MKTVRKMLAVGVAALTLMTATVPAHAQFTVFDPSNYAQNVLTARARCSRSTTRSLRCRTRRSH